MVEQLEISERAFGFGLSKGQESVQIILSQKMHLFSYTFHLLWCAYNWNPIPFPTAIASSAGGQLSYNHSTNYPSEMVTCFTLSISWQSPWDVINLTQCQRSLEDYITDRFDS